MRFRHATLGCKVNQYETQYARAALLESGWIEATDDEDEQVGLVLVNTCAVTAESDAKSRKLVAHWHHRCPHARIVVMGCSATLHPVLTGSLPGVVQVVTDKRKLSSFLNGQGLVPPCHGILSFGERHRAYIKIQDGCRVGCSYCIIPKVRPYLVSRSASSILDETRSFVSAGYRELVLTGIHLGHYGLDFFADGTNQALSELLTNRDEKLGPNHSLLARLLIRLVELKLPVRFRLGSLEAVEATSDLIAAVSDHPGAVCPHFHLSMQSGDNDVLARMKRRWPSERFLERCHEIRERIPNVALTTDVIVGFPGETEEQFERTCDVCRQVGFSKIHLFRYSARPGTEAAVMPHQIPGTVKKERLERLARVAEELRLRYMESFVGQPVQMLVEESGNDRVTGTTGHYLPMEWRVPNGVPLPATGTIVAVRVTSVSSGNEETQTLCSTAMPEKNQEFLPHPNTTK